jgi:tRNA modification GTPase
MANPDTIAAVGTAPGTSALAVVRLSGPDSAAIVSSLCPGLSDRLPARRASFSRAMDPQTGKQLDQVVVTYFPGPDSYSGEDMAEISCHGGWLPPSLILEACKRLGAREAQEGEFTRRAYLNGKMDLLQVEAVLDLIEGRSRALHGTAVHHLERGLSRRISELREGLVHLEALLVHHLDFPEEDDPPVPVREISESARELEDLMEDLLETAPEGELLREGAVTVLAGRPNTGKSSLFNALLGQDRAIVTEVPGTTRDALEAVVSLGGFPFRLVDTAGLRETQEAVEQLGVEVAWRYLKGADLVLFCVEDGRELGSEELQFLADIEGTPLVLVRTKADVSGRKGTEGIQDEAGEGSDPEEGRLRTKAVGSTTGSEADPVEPSVRLSVKSGEGLGTLLELLPSLVFEGLVGQELEVPVLTRKRHADGVETALRELRAFRKALVEGMPAEFAATHLRPGENALEELLGVIPKEEILDRLFRDFCIGK